jgi:hypothetical protein
MTKDYSFFEKTWFEMPLGKRKNINMRITHKSLHKAIDLKSASMAASVASFTSKTFDDTTLAARHEYERTWLNYYKGIRDTAAALATAIEFYDKYPMTISPGVERIRDSINHRKAFDTAQIEKVEDPNEPGKFISRRRINYKPLSGYYAAELTQGAALVYNSSNNPVYLQKALAWAKRAREFSNFVDVQNTYAKLLYVTGNKAEAIALEKETINNLKRVGRNPKNQESILLQMEANQKLKDRL